MVHKSLGPVPAQLGQANCLWLLLLVNLEQGILCSSRADGADTGIVSTLLLYIGSIFHMLREGL